MSEAELHSGGGADIEGNIWCKCVNIDRWMEGAENVVHLGVILMEDGRMLIQKTYFTYFPSTLHVCVSAKNTEEQWSDIEAWKLHTLTLTKLVVAVSKCSNTLKKAKTLPPFQPALARSDGTQYLYLLCLSSYKNSTPAQQHTSRCCKQAKKTGVCLTV